MGGDDSTMTLGDTLAAPDDARPDVQIELASTANAARAALKEAASGTLTAREWDVLRRRATGERLESIGQRYGVTRERTRQIEKQAKERMQVALRRHRRIVDETLGRGRAA